MDLPAIPFQYSLTVEGEYVVKMRLEPAKVSPAAYHAMLELESFVNKSSTLEVSLLDLVKMSARGYQVGWRGSFAEKQVGPTSPECLALLRKLRARPAAPVQF